MKKMKNKKESCENNELILDNTNLFELSKSKKVILLKSWTTDN